MKRVSYFFCFFLFSIGHCTFAQEICDNAKDDDGDGLVDLHDPECQCHFTVKGNLLQNASFESFANCPSNYSYDEDAAIADHWRYGTFTNVNDAEYYHNFNCPADSATVMLYMPPALPLPDGDGFMSIRQYIYRKPGMAEKDIAKVYISQCLQTALKAGEDYTISFSAGRFQSNDDPGFKYKSTPFTVAIFGNSSCDAVPFGPPHAYSNGCAANYPGWVLLGKTTVNNKGKWVQSRINFTVPPGVNVIEIGPDCSVLHADIDLADSTTFLDFYVYYLDDLHLLKTADFHFPAIQNQSGNPCIADPVINAPVIANAGYQWYKDSIAIIGATSGSYRIDGSASAGYYNVRITTGDSCRISESFPFGLSDLSTLRLPADTSFCESDSFLLAPPLNGVTYRCNGVIGPVVKIFRPGTYSILALDQIGCTKKFVVTVHATKCTVNIPNTFSPNGDGTNDIFRLPPGITMHLPEISVFDRYGNKIFYSNSNQGWDGTFKGNNCAAGIYLYKIDGLINNRYKHYRGTVTLIR